ncbi:protein transport protein Sec31A-like [Sinocyclocheilus grahami]|uniref:protein transport protein Sec31A-like n=1 Tax=Sinocyclocheilus grahami TaxID=75366 RepID=UPI0007AC5E92|nr:PREDICTED: protein transport protein Sec31A-like [Sinocyclocheilus grahami]
MHEFSAAVLEISVEGFVRKMRVKEILRAATQAWSPAMKHPAYLALGTAAQQLDASFNTSAALEIFEMDFADTSMDMKLRGTLPTSNRFHSLIWVAFDMEVKGSSGRLIGGSESGTVSVFSPDAILSAGEDAVIGQSNKHTGPVHTLDYNRFQSNIIASGASDSEIYIWDLNNFSNPMTPGAKSQPAEDVSVVAWNCQVQHILASANPSGKAIVWDLRKNEPIIKISDHSNRMHCSGMLWHPDVATQLLLASEDDRLPVMQMWDLRFATSPLKVLESHTRGILSISWSQADPELLLSSGKDNRILCWNPNTGEVIYELPTANQWCFDVQWCPRNPALLSAASFDGRISVYSVMGGRLQQQQHSTVDQISASFDTSDPFGSGQALPPLQAPQPSVEITIIPPLKKPPKWERRPVGASFAFGGKLVMFESPKVAPQQQPIPRQVHVSQVTTETAFLQRSAELQATLQSRSFSSYCHGKIRSAPSDAEQDIWRFLMVNFEDEARVKFLRLLGFSKDELQRKISACLGRKLHPNGLDVNDLAEKMQTLSDQGEARRRTRRAKRDDGREGRDDGREGRGETRRTRRASRGETDEKSEARRTGQGETRRRRREGRDETDEKGEARRMRRASRDETDEKSEARRRTRRARRDDGREGRDETDEKGEARRDGREEKVPERKTLFFIFSIPFNSKLISSVVTQNWRDIVQSCELDNWKEALAALLTYANPEAFAPLCDTLGARLQAEGTEKRCLQACLCFICSGNIERLVECWTSQRDCSSPLELEDLVEKVMILRKSIERLRSGEVCVQSSALTEKLIQYSSILASQGSLSSALRYLPDSPDQAGVQMLRQRLLHAKGEILQRPQPSAPAGGAKGPANTHTLAAHTQVRHCTIVSSVQDGWNDPPAVRAGQRKKKLPENYTPPAPITAPVMGFSAEAPGPHDRVQVPPGAPQESSIQSLQQLPAEHVEQKEIPAEHMILKTTFSSLVQRCQLAAADPQTKRKLDDASKRLESLYDKLRDQALSPSILGGLHEISRCVGSRNYQQGLEVHTQVVSSSNFSEISAFMPVLKMLMTIANKLAV